MPEPPLDRPGVVALVGQRVAAGVAQLVRVCLELQAGAGSDAPDRAGEVARGEERLSLADKDEGATTGSPAGAMPAARRPGSGRGPFRRSRARPRFRPTENAVATDNARSLPP
jgi:hypothetical protein